MQLTIEITFEKCQWVGKCHFPPSLTTTASGAQLHWVIRAFITGEAKKNIFTNKGLWLKSEAYFICTDLVDAQYVDKIYSLHSSTVK